MKLRIDIDCTPEEARRLLGLPDVSEMNQAVADAVRERIEEAVRTFDAEDAAQRWVEAAVGGMGRLQEALWSQMTPPKGKGKG